MLTVEKNDNIKIHNYTASITESSAKILPDSDCALGLSIGGAAHENGQLKATLITLKRTKIKHYHFVIADELQRFTLSTLNNAKLDPDDLREIAIKKGDEWIERNEDTIREVVGNNFTYIRWAEITKKKSFQEWKQKFENDNSNEFLESVQKTIDAFMDHYNNKGYSLEVIFDQTPKKLEPKKAYLYSDKEDENKIKVAFMNKNNEKVIIELSKENLSDNWEGINSILNSNENLQLKSEHVKAIFDITSKEGCLDKNTIVERSKQYIIEELAVLMVIGLELKIPYLAYPQHAIAAFEFIQKKYLTFKEENKEQNNEENKEFKYLEFVRIKIKSKHSENINSSINFLDIKNSESKETKANNIEFPIKISENTSSLFAHKLTPTLKFELVTKAVTESTLKLMMENRLSEEDEKKLIYYASLLKNAMMQDPNSPLVENKKIKVHN